MKEALGKMGLFLDLGKCTGVCLRGLNEIIFVKQLGDKKAKITQGEVYRNFYDELSGILNDYGKYISYMGYENAFHQKSIAREYFMGQLGILKMLAHDYEKPIYMIPTQTAKKFGVGNNTGNKDTTVRVVNARWEAELDEPLTDDEDNAADAITVGCGFYGMLQTNPFKLKESY